MMCRAAETEALARLQIAESEISCAALLLGSSVYSVTELDDRWSVEILFDNSLHNGYGASENEAVCSAVAVIVSGLETAQCH